MIPRCGPQTGLTHSYPAQPPKGGIQEALLKKSKNFYPSLSIFVTFKSLGLAEL